MINYLSSLKLLKTSMEALNTIKIRMVNPLLNTREFKKKATIYM